MPAIVAGAHLGATIDALLARFLAQREEARAVYQDLLHQCGNRTAVPLQLFLRARQDGLAKARRVDSCRTGAATAQQLLVPVRSAAP